jgi:hypothetical protein
MSYWFTRYGSTDLSQIELRQRDELAAALGLLSLPGGGVHDPWGSAQAPVKLPGRITLDSELVEADAASFKTAVYALRALIGTRALLYRSPDGEAANSESALARLEGVSMSRNADNILVLGTTLTFEILQSVWDGADGTVAATLDTTPKSIVVANDGNARVDDAVITIVAKTSSITVLTVAVAGVSSFTWTGTLVANKALVINCGARTVKNDGADAYSGFVLDAGHTVAEWLRLQPGNNTVVITRTGGDATSTYSIAFADGWR